MDFRNYHVYILQGESNNTRKKKPYVGKTNYLLRRILQHLKGGSGFGKRHKNIKLKFFEQFGFDWETNKPLAQNIVGYVPQYHNNELTYKRLFNYKRIFKDLRSKW